MLSSITSPDGMRWRRLLAAAGAALLIVGAVTSYTLLAHGNDSGQPASLPGADSVPNTSAPAEADPTTSVAVVPGSDPDVFAREVAEALFAWDTSTLTTLADLTERLVVLADPTGESSAGLVADVANYLPTLDAWTELRRYETRQWIEITSTEVPGLWPTAVEQAGPDGLLPGTAAYTIRGVRHRSGIWEGDPVSSTHDVAFTVFVVCGPSYPQCHLLRLSRLDEPLD